MKRLLKICTFVLAFVMLFSFAACGESQVPPQEEAHAESISLAGMQTQFAYGDEFSADGLTVTVRYSDGTSRKATPLEYTVDSSAYKSDVAGSYEIAVKFGSLTSKYTVTVAEQVQGEPEAVSLALSGMKLNFTVGESFSAEGLVVTAHYSDGNDCVLSSEEYEIDSSAYKSDTAGDYEIVVKFGTIERSYTVTVANNVQSTWEEDGVLKILLIGSSYTEDTYAYAWQICNSLGIDAEIAALEYVGDLDALNSALYGGGTNLEIWMTSKETGGEMIIESGKSAEEAIKSRNWDFITIHHQSSRAGVEAEFSSLNPVLERLREIVPEDTRLAWLLTWAYRELYKNETPVSALAGQYGTYENYFNSDQMTMYRALVQTTQKKIVPTGLEIVPIGTAIQNLRTSFVGDTLTRDLIHLSLGLGRYTAAMTLISALTGTSLGELTFRPEGVSAREQTVTIEAVENAVKTPFAVTQSKYR